jgi:hypothetical protein
LLYRSGQVSSCVDASAEDLKSEGDVGSSRCPRILQKRQRYQYWREVGGDIVDPAAPHSKCGDSCLAAMHICAHVSLSIREITSTGPKQEINEIRYKQPEQRGEQLRDQLSFLCNQNG